MFLNTVFTQEDIMNSTLNRLYSVSKGEKVIIDGIDLYRIVLKPKTKNGAYKQIITYIRTKNKILYKREYYSYTDELIKELYLNRIIKRNDIITGIELTVYDLIEKGKNTRVIFSDINPDVKLNPKIFDPRYLPYIR